MNNDWIVYKHTFPNGKVYYGITSRNEGDRWRNGRGYEHQPKIFDAIIKYGWDNILHEIIAYGITHEEALLKEKQFISAEVRGKTYNVVHKNKQDRLVSTNDSLFSLCRDIPDNLYYRILNDYNCAPISMRKYDDRIEMDATKAVNNTEKAMFVALFPEDGIKVKEFTDWLCKANWKCVGTWKVV